MPRRRMTTVVKSALIRLMPWYSPTVKPASSPHIEFLIRENERARAELVAEAYKLADERLRWVRRT